MNEELQCSWYDPSCALSWLKDEFQAFALWLWDSLISSFAFLLEAFPVPDFLINLPSYSMPSGVAWAVAPFQIEYGLLIIVGAYTARFVLRRIPVIG